MVSKGLRWVNGDKVQRDEVLQSEALEWRVKGVVQVGVI
jgi:hypothetical protein